MAAQLDVLRAFRDEYLLNNVVGSALVDLYYSLSPAMATIIADSPVLTALTRTLLAPIVFAGKAIVAAPHTGVVLVLVAIAAAVVARTKKGSKVR